MTEPTEAQIKEACEKANALIRTIVPPNVLTKISVDPKTSYIDDAFVRLVMEHEAFRQRVSDLVKSVKYTGHWMHGCMLDSLILPDPTPTPEQVLAGDDITSVCMRAVEDELRRARAKFPGDRIMTIALAEEFGELAKAMLDEDGAAVWKEAVQTAVMAARVAIDGDSSVDKWRAAKGLGEHRWAGNAPQHCDHCGASRGSRSHVCAPPFAVQPHEYTGKHPADRFAKRGHHVAPIKGDE